MLGIQLGYRLPMSLVQLVWFWLEVRTLREEMGRNSCPGALSVCPLTFPVGSIHPTWASPRKINVIYSCYSKRGPRPTSISIIWELVKSAESQPQLRPTESESTFDKIPQEMHVHVKIWEALLCTTGFWEIVIATTMPYNCTTLVLSNLLHAHIWMQASQIRKRL